MRGVAMDVIETKDNVIVKASVPRTQREAKTCCMEGRLRIPQTIP